MDEHTCEVKLPHINRNVGEQDNSTDAKAHLGLELGKGYGRFQTEDDEEEVGTPGGGVIQNTTYAASQGPGGIVANAGFEEPEYVT